MLGNSTLIKLIGGIVLAGSVGGVAGTWLMGEKTQLDSQNSIKNLAYQKSQIEQCDRNITQLTTEISTQTEEVKDLQSQLNALVEKQKENPEYLFMNLLQKKLDQYESEHPEEPKSLAGKIAHIKPVLEELEKDSGLQEIKQAKSNLDQKIKTLENNTRDMSENKKMKAELSREVQLLEHYASLSSKNTAGK